MQVAPGIFDDGHVIARRYEIENLLGRGGFSEVYLAFDREESKHYALRTLRDVHFSSLAMRNGFLREIAIWFSLAKHPFIVTLNRVINEASRIIMILEYIAPDNSNLTTLNDHLRSSKGPIGDERVLEWAIQFCFGMEYANMKGLQCHRDIKPDNLFITGTDMLRISDFGLASALDGISEGGNLISGEKEDGAGLSLFNSGTHKICGTPGYIPPEILRGKDGGIQSDIHSFGSVLWQMITGETCPPFHVPFDGDIEELVHKSLDIQMTGDIPDASSCLMPVIRKCLQPLVENRFLNFTELRLELQELLAEHYGKNLEEPEKQEADFEYLNAIGASFCATRQLEQALRYINLALDLKPHSAEALYTNGMIFYYMERFEDGIEALNLAIENDKQFVSPLVYKGFSLINLGLRDQAMECCEQALALSPDNDGALNLKANVSLLLGKYNDAISCLERIIEIKPADAHIMFNNMARIYIGQGNYEKAIDCCGKTLEIAPFFHHAMMNKGEAYLNLDEPEKALECCLDALEINSTYPYGWYVRALSEDALNRREDAAKSYRKFLELSGHVSDPESENARARLKELEG